MTWLRLHKVQCEVERIFQMFSLASASTKVHKSMNISRYKENYLILLLQVIRSSSLMSQ